VQNEKFDKISRNEPKMHTLLRNITQDLAASMKICALDNCNVKCELLPKHTHTQSPIQQTENISYEEPFFQLDSTEYRLVITSNINNVFSFLLHMANYTDFVKHSEKS
jgi:hypothetical protein